MTMRPHTRIPTDIDRGCYLSMHHVLRPEFHGLIEEWMKTAGEVEKRGIMKLGQIGEPTLSATVGRPRPGGHMPATMSHSWHHPKKIQTGHVAPSGWPVRDHDTQGYGGSGAMGRSFSSPGFGMQQEQPRLFSWQVDDERETAMIEKPGGYVVELKDGVEIQRKKNAQRNKGTYKLFGGTFDGTTTNAACHNLRSIGLEQSA
eukprot:TRINITY_DN69901_c0_g1_i1.p1 TRINITY_DN69901_c0_g1~~TRINITY_DN69901_c0_g1_i1.p1  ORF type:complete len:202 (-),score=28.91 TRINITY_DN69901_c0_g1_i1:206-811(-)